jgi:hypothetical protein
MLVFMIKLTGWQRSCSTVAHNMVVYGERELRGDRRRKGGRSLLVTAATSFIVGLLVPPPAAAQSPVVWVRGGVTASSTVVRDLVASPQVRQLLGGRVDEDVRLTAAPGATLGAGVRVPLRPGLALDAGADWTRTELRVTDAGGTRPLQDLSVVQGSAGVSRILGRRLELGAAVGVVHYDTERRGLFSEGSRLAPMVEGRAAWTLPVASQRIALAGSAQLHRFITPAMTQAGGEEGMVGRFALMARVRLLEVGR